MGILNATTELLPLPNNHIVKNFYLKRRQFFDKFSSNAIDYTNEKMNRVYLMNEGKVTSISFRSTFIYFTTQIIGKLSFLRFPLRCMQKIITLFNLFYENSKLIDLQKIVLKYSYTSNFCPLISFYIFFWI